MPLISGLKYAADPYTKLQEIVFWLIGSLANPSGGICQPVAAIILCSGAPFFIYILKKQKVMR
ncbi:MAG: hypothetical protein QMC67_00375 [Candidatus Wallbacteria bacterium]